VFHLYFSCQPHPRIICHCRSCIITNRTEHGNSRKEDNNEVTGTNIPTLPLVAWMSVPRRLDISTRIVIGLLLQRRGRPWHIHPAALVRLHRQRCRWSEATRSHGLIQLRMVLVAVLVVLPVGVLPVPIKLSVLVFCWRGAEALTVRVVAVGKRAGITVVRMRNGGCPGHG
jgi:hypothetical protein